MSERQSIRFMCPQCHGKGLEPHILHCCPTCGGSGTVGSYLELARAFDLPRLISEDNRRHSVKA